MFYVIANLNEIFGLPSWYICLLRIFSDLSYMIGAKVIPNYTLLQAMFHGTLFQPLPYGQFLGRNYLIFLGIFIPFHILRQNAISHATRFFFLSTVHSGHSTPLSIKCIRWSLAPFPYVTINTDGSSIGNPGKSGAGGVACSSNGEWLWCFSLHLGVTNNTMVELWGIREALA